MLYIHTLSSLCLVSPFSLTTQSHQKTDSHEIIFELYSSTLLLELKKYWITSYSFSLLNSVKVLELILAETNSKQFRSLEEEILAPHSDQLGWTVWLGMTDSMEDWKKVLQDLDNFRTWYYRWEIERKAILPGVPKNLCSNKTRGRKYLVLMHCESEAKAF